MDSLRLRIAGLGLLVVATGCGEGDNSGAVKTHAGIKPGMPIWDALGVADNSQFPDIAFRASGKKCSHAGVEAGRRFESRYVRVIRRELAEYPGIASAYVEEGFATREEFINAVQSKVALFTGCEAIVFLMDRNSGLPSDSFEVTLDTDGRIIPSLRLNESLTDRLAAPRSPMTNLIIPGTLLLLAIAATLLRKTTAWRRWSVALVIFAALTAWGISDTRAPHSVWLNVPVMGGPTFGSVFVASIGPLQQRPALAFLASLGAAVGGLLVGMVVAIELGLLRP